MRIPLTITKTQEIISCIEWSIEACSDISSWDYWTVSDEVEWIISQLPENIWETVRKKVDTFISDFKKRCDLVSKNSKEGVFETIFWFSPEWETIIEVWKYSLHFILSTKDFEKMKSIEWGNGFCMNSKYGAITVECHWDNKLRMMLWEEKKLKWDNIKAHEKQHAKYIYTHTLLQKHKSPDFIEGLFEIFYEWFTNRVANEALAMTKSHWRKSAIEALSELYAIHYVDIWKVRRKLWNKITEAEVYYLFGCIHKEIMRVIRNICNAVYNNKENLEALTIIPVEKWHKVLWPDYNEECFQISVSYKSWEKIDTLEEEYYEFEKFDFPVKVINPDKKKRKVVVVIPSYNEWNDILESLYSISRQVGIDTEDFSIVVSINHNKEAKGEVKKGNNKTFYLLQAIIKWKIPDGLSKRELKMFAFIIWIQMHISIVDSFTKWEEKELMNVWIARDLGSYVWCEFIEDEKDCIVNIDADTNLDRDYLMQLVDAQNWIEYVGGFSGNVIFRKNVDELSAVYERERLKWAYNMFASLYVEEGVSKYSHPDNWDFDYIDSISLFSWCNMAVRKQVFQEVWWFRHIDWAEDVLLATDINSRYRDFQWEDYDIGPIQYNEKLTVRPLSRVSDRTHKDHGHWQQILKEKENMSPLEETLVESLEAKKFYQDITRVIWLANFESIAFKDSKKMTWDKWVNFVFKSLKSDYLKLRKRDIEDLYEEHSKVNYEWNVHTNHFLEKAIQKLMWRLFKPVTIKSQLNKVKEKICEWEIPKTIETEEWRWKYLGTILFYRQIQEKLIPSLEIFKKSLEWIETLVQDFEEIYWNDQDLSENQLNSILDSLTYLKGIFQISVYGLIEFIFFVDLYTRIWSTEEDSDNEIVIIMKEVKEKYETMFDFSFEGKWITTKVHCDTLRQVILRSKSQEMISFSLRKCWLHEDISAIEWAYRQIKDTLKWVQI